MKINKLSDDLEHILINTSGDVWESLRDKKIFLTGGTGFFGKWLLESFIYVNEKLKLNSSVTVLTRNINGFKTTYPHLYDQKCINFIEGDVRSFQYPTGNFNFIIHAATDVSDKLNKEEPLTVMDTIVNGTRHILEFARNCKAESFLNISSGAVYGKQPSETEYIYENYEGAPSPLLLGSVYGEGKRMTELLSVIYSEQYGFKTVSARCFAFVGPYLNLNIHFAIGNFIRDGLQGKPIFINGDGTPYRSYLYSADLAIWLWTILIKGKSGEAYNVGSDEQISIKELALKVAGFFENTEVQCKSKPLSLHKISRYVPSVDKAKKDLDLRINIDLKEAIRRTIKYYGHHE